MADVTTQRFETRVKGRELYKALFKRISELDDADLNKHDFYRVVPKNDGLKFSEPMCNIPVLVLSYNPEQREGAVLMINNYPMRCPVSSTGRPELIEESISGLEELSEIGGEGRIELKKSNLHI
jgi:hypothetical protein